MAVDAASHRRPGPLPRSLALARVSARTALAALVALSVTVRAALAAAHTTPYFFPDEYLYATLARSLAEGRVAVRGTETWFPALLEPLVTAPLWLLSDPELSLRLTQLVHVVAMSLAAVPVYLLARHLRLGTGFSLGAAAVAVAVPDLLYAAFLLADPLGYPLALTAVLLAVRALDRPTARSQAAFLAVAGLAAATRIQYAVLPLAFLAGALAVERLSLRAVWRSYRPALAVLGLALVAALAFGLRALGPYAAGVRNGVAPEDALAWLGTDALLAAYAAGWVLVPGAVVALAAGIARPRSRAEAGFAAVTSTLALGLLAGAALIAAHDSGRFQERYLFPLFPLLALAFGLWARSERTRRLPAALVAAAMLALASALPVTGYAVGPGRVDSPFLWAVFRVLLDVPLADVALAISATAAALSLVAAALAFRPRAAAAVGLGATLAIFLVVGAAAFSHAEKSAAIVRGTDLPADAHWIDATGLRDVALVQTPGGTDRSALLQLFWNRSVTDVFTLADAEPPDSWGSTPLRVGEDGALLAGDAGLRRPVLFQRYGTSARFADAELVAAGGTWELWHPHGDARFSLLAAGHYHDGWLSGGGAIFVWPAEGTGGTLELALSMPPRTGEMTVAFSTDGTERRVTLAPGKSARLSLPLSGCGPWTVSYRAEVPGRIADGREVSVRSSVPLHRPAPAAAADCTV